MESISAKTLPGSGGRRERAGRSKGGIVCKFRSIPGATDEEQREGNNELGCTDEDNERIDSPVCGSMLSGRHPVVDANKGTWEPKLLHVGRPRERRARGKGCSCRHEIVCVVATRRYDARSERGEQRDLPPLLSAPSGYSTLARTMKDNNSMWSLLLAAGRVPILKSSSEGVKFAQQDKM